MTEKVKFELDVIHGDHASHSPYACTLELYGKNDILAQCESNADWEEIESGYAVYPFVAAPSKKGRFEYTYKRDRFGVFVKKLMVPANASIEVTSFEAIISFGDITEGDEILEENLKDFIPDVEESLTDFIGGFRYKVPLCKKQLY